MLSKLLHSIGSEQLTRLTRSTNLCIYQIVHISDNWTYSHIIGHIVSISTMLEAAAAAELRISNMCAAIIVAVDIAMVTGILH